MLGWSWNECMFLIQSQCKNASLQKSLFILFLMVKYWLLCLMIHSDENCSVLRNYAACSGNSLPTLWDNLLVPFSSWHLKMGPTGCPEASVRNYHYTLCNNPEECSSLLLNTRSLISHMIYILLIKN